MAKELVTRMLKITQVSSADSNLTQPRLGGGGGVCMKRRAKLQPPKSNKFWLNTVTTKTNDFYLMAKDIKLQKLVT